MNKYCSMLIQSHLTLDAKSGKYTEFITHNTRTEHTQSNGIESKRIRIERTNVPLDPVRNVYWIERRAKNWRKLWQKCERARVIRVYFSVWIRTYLWLSRSLLRLHCERVILWWFREKSGKSEFKTDNELLWGCRWYCWDQRYCKTKSFDNNTILSNKILYLDKPQQTTTTSKKNHHHHHLHHHTIVIGIIVEKSSAANRFQVIIDIREEFQNPSIVNFFVWLRRKILESIWYLPKIIITLTSNYELLYWRFRRLRVETIAEQ